MSIFSSISKKSKSSKKTKFKPLSTKDIKSAGFIPIKKEKKPVVSKKAVQRGFLVFEKTPKTKAEKARARKTKRIQKRVWRKLI